MPKSSLIESAKIFGQKWVALPEDKKQVGTEKILVHAVLHATWVVSTILFGIPFNSRIPVEQVNAAFSKTLYYMCVSDRKQ